MKQNTTLVSALFYIGRDKWEHYKLDQNMYLNWYKNTISLGAKHIIYTDEYFYYQVRQIMDSLNLLDGGSIRVIKMKLEDLPAYNYYYPKLSTLMSSDMFKARIPFKVPEAVYPLYNIIMFNKVFFLEDAIKSNPHYSTRFAWVDAGGLREDNKNYRGVQWPSPEKIERVDPTKIHFFCHHPVIRIANVDHHSLSQMRYIQGTAFFTSRESLTKFIPLFHETVNECMDRGFIGSDEKIFDLCYLKKPDLFNLEVSSWREYFDRYK